MARPFRRAGRASAQVTLRLEGPRVLVRLARRGDREAFLRLIRASRAHLAPWEPRWRDPTGALRFERVLAAARDPGTWKGLVVRREDGALLGQVNLNNVVRGVAQSASLGYWLGAEHVGQGYVTEALGLLIAHAFRTLGLHRLEINVMPHNRRSRAVARRVGFRSEGRSRSFLQIAGRWEDHVRYALLAEEWRAMQRASARKARRPAKARARRGGHAPPTSAKTVRARPAS